MSEGATRPIRYVALAVAFVLCAWAGAACAHEPPNAMSGSSSTDRAPGRARGPSSYGDRTGPVGPEDRSVVVIGDSITFITTDELTSPRIDRIYEVRAALGATSLQMLDDAAQMADDEPAQVIINVGTNDALQAARPSETVAVVDEMIRLFPDARCVHLTTISELMVTMDDPELPERVRNINTGLRTLAERPGVDLIEWNRLVRARATWATAPSLLSDTVHPTEEGQALLAQLYRRSVDRCGAVEG